MTRRIASLSTARLQRRRIRRAGLVALAGLLVWAVAGLPFLVFPHVDPLPHHADVAFVLGPATPQRVAIAERLLHQGRVGQVLVSTPGGQRSDPGDPVRQMCHAQARLSCDVPDPSTTQGEARMLQRDAASHGWRSAIIITMGSQLTRARVLVARCFTGSLTMRPSGEPPFLGWLYQYGYQTGATIKAWLHPGC